MLTADLVKSRCQKGRIIPLYLRGPQVSKYLPFLTELLGVFERCEGMTVDELDDAIKMVTPGDADRVRVTGFVKLLKDRCEVEQVDPTQSEEDRAWIFSTAAQYRRELRMLDVFDRQAVLEACATQRGCSALELDRTLFSDLPGAQTITRWKRLSAEGLIARYNLALAQGVLIRSVGLAIHLEPAPASRIRDLFRTIKFCRLMYQVSGDATAGYELSLDGPLSLFESTQRYGVQLAMILPTLVAGDGWRLRADVIRPRDRIRLLFHLCPEDGLLSSHETPAELEEVDSLRRAFSRLNSEWEVRAEPRIFDIRGKGVFVPDLVFDHKTTGARVYLEVFGYWSRASVFKRLEQLDGDFPYKVILAVSRKLRVSEEAAEDTFPGRIIVYSQAISAHAVRGVLDQIVNGESDESRPRRAAKQSV